MDFKRSRKIVSVLLALAVVFSLWFIPSQGDQASAAGGGNILLEEKTVTISNSQAKNGIQSAESESVLDDKQKQAVDALNQKNLEKVDVPENSVNLKPGEIPIGAITVKYSLSANSSTKKLTSTMTIVDITGVPPTILSGSQFPQHSNYDDPIMGDWYWDDIFDNLSFSLYGDEIREGFTVSQTFPSETKWWSIFGGVSAYYAVTGDHEDVDWETDFELVNKNAVVFPDHYDPPSGKWASDGVRTDWEEVPVGERTVWNNYTRGIAIAEYISTYGDPGYKWKQSEPGYKQMHHMRPLLYGGTNDLSNLIPIEEAKHIPITSWFTGY